MNESKLDLTNRLCREGRWAQASVRKEEIRRELRASDATRTAAVEAAWERIADEYPPIVADEPQPTTFPWAKQIMPAVLQRLMRHESIDTTMGYYVDLDANELAESLYRADEQGNIGQEGTVLGTVGQSVPEMGSARNDVTPM